MLQTHIVDLDFHQRTKFLTIIHDFTRMLSMYVHFDNFVIVYDQ